MEAIVRPFLGVVGVDETYIMTVERTIKKTKAVTPELEIFAESDRDGGSPPPEERAPIFATSPVKKKLTNHPHMVNRQ